MPSLATTAAFAISVILPAVQAGGNAIINNKCAFDVAVWPVDATRSSYQPVIIKAGGQYAEPYHTPPAGGVSLKIANHANAGGPITQLEYTVLPMGLFYDVSNIDCKGPTCPFQPYGLNLRSGNTCPGMSCAAGAPTCTGAYNNPDDVRTLACTEQNPDTVLDLCTQNAGHKRDIVLPAKEPSDASPERRDSEKRAASGDAQGFDLRAWAAKVKATLSPQRRTTEKRGNRGGNIGGRSARQSNGGPRHPHARPT